MNTTLSFLVTALTCLLIVYFIQQIYNHTSKREAHRNELDTADEKEELDRLRRISLSEPLSEKARPACFSDIIGQEDGIRALKAALCGENPQHVIIYGPPGVGKTCAARLVLEEAKSSQGTPFAPEAPFVEIDATCVRFDERSIADPLIGSVHDPIYQGAGSFGRTGIPQPKPGAVTKAHGGVLFLDEIGELHPNQMNKLLKVLEDRKVMLESAYYNRRDRAVPHFIRDSFENGLPADFRLVAATTRSPSELPSALRSRCIEVFFRALSENDLTRIASDAAAKSGKHIDEDAARMAARYSGGGRDAVNIVQLACGLASNEGRGYICTADILWIANVSHFSEQRPRIPKGERTPGCVFGLAVLGASMGMVIEIEAIAAKTAEGKGTLCITGFAEGETSGGYDRKITRKSTAKSSVENVLSVLRTKLGVKVRDYDIHVNIPGGIPVDGPSAGIAVAAAVFSAITGSPVPGHIAMTGEISLTGAVKPVGGVKAKLEAAAEAGVKRVYIPADNGDAELPAGLDVIPVSGIVELFASVFLPIRQKRAAV